MTIQSITVSSGRTFNHPYEDYSNLKPHVSLTAVLDPSEDPVKAIKALQAQAESVVEDHKRSLLSSLEELHRLKEHTREIHSLELEMQRAQQRLDDLRAGLNNGLLPETQHERGAF